jgi:anti-anti-sigma factor
MSNDSLSIEHQSPKRCDLFRIRGRIDGASAPRLEQALRSALDNGRYKLVLNLADVTFLSSAGLRVLITIAKECRRFNRGNLYLAAPNQRVQQVLELAGLDELFPTFATEVEAVGNL